MLTAYLFLCKIITFFIATSLLLSDDEIESFNRRRLEGKSAFISTDDTKFMSTNEWHPQDMIEEHFTEYNYLSSSLEINMNQFYAVPLNNRHQITNEWGAYKLAYTARLFNLLPIIEEKQPASKTIYFKYLKRKMLENSSNTEGISTPSQSVSTIKYLLIDDNHDKGWSSVFDAIFQQVDTQLGIVAYQNIAQINENITIAITEIIAEIEDKKYQGVLLDLRLTNEDDKPDKGNTEILNFSGGKILKALKDKYPFLPVIMVTASNKAWNMQQLLDAGADGYFIKEDPESNPS